MHQPIEKLYRFTKLYRDPAWLHGKVFDLSKRLQSTSLVLVKPKKDMNNKSCRRDMTEILLKVV